MYGSIFINYFTEEEEEEETVPHESLRNASINQEQQKSVIITNKEDIKSPEQIAHDLELKKAQCVS